MSYPYDPVRILPIAVGPDGAVEFLGMRWWSEESTKLKGRSVELRLCPSPRRTEAALMSVRGAFLCKVDLIDDGGLFQREEGAEKAIDAIEQKHRDLTRAAVLAEECRAKDDATLVIRRKMEALIEVVDERIDATLVVESSLGARLISQALGFLRKLVKNSRILTLKDAHHRDLKEAEVLEVPSQLSLLVLKHGEALFGCGRGHEVSPDLVDAQKSNEVAETGHRLSGDAK